MQTTQDRLDERDLAELIGEHRNPLLRFVVRLTHGDRHLAEDFVQETILRIWQRPSLLATHHSSIRPWLFTVARNLVTDHYRRKARAAEILASHDDVATDNHDEATVLTHDMTAALTRLSPQHRDAIRAVFYEGQAFTEAAQELGVPVGTLKSRVHYGLRALRNIFCAAELSVGAAAAA